MIKVMLYTLMIAILAVIALKDIKTRIIDQGMLAALLAVGVGLIITDDELTILSSTAAMTVVVLLLGMVRFFSKKSMGIGDIKLCAAVAFCLGVERTFSMLIISVILCGITGLLLLLLKKVDKNWEIPFAPFVLLGTLATLAI